jgi:hypothetical protein
MVTIRWNSAWFCGFSSAVIAASCSGAPIAILALFNQSTFFTHPT